MPYSDKVIDHYENPRNVGSMAKDDPNVGTGIVGAPACGDVMKLQLKIGDDGIIQDAKFKTFGCGSAIASSSLVTEGGKGMTVDQAMGLKNTAIVEELHLPPVKIHCSVLAGGASKAAIGAEQKEEGSRVMISITDKAVGEIRKQAEKRGKPGSALRVGIRGGGCTGFSYLFEWSDGEPRVHDKVFEKDGVRLFVDPKSFVYLDGTE